MRTNVSKVLVHIKIHFRGHRLWHSPVASDTSGPGIEYISLKCIDSKTCGQSYKAPTIVIYDSRVIPDLKLPHITTLEL